MLQGAVGKVHCFERRERGIIKLFKNHVLVQPGSGRGSGRGMYTIGSTSLLSLPSS